MSSDAVPAATTILLRDTPDGLETLMLRRTSKLAFAAGAWVFPGGRVDPDDLDPDAPSDELAAARNAAVREAREEADLYLDPTAMVVLSKWCPPPEAPRRFNTWFFVAAAPAGAVTVDGGEIDDHLWIRPHDAIQRHAAGEIELIPPTWLTLHQISVHDTSSAAIAAIDAATPGVWVTKLVSHPEQGRVILWEPDAGWEAGDINAPGPRNRIWLDEPGWRYEYHTKNGPPPS